MNPESSDENRETSQINTSAEAIESASIETGDLEGAARSIMPEEPRPFSTPRMKVQS